MRPRTVPEAIDAVVARHSLTHDQGAALALVVDRIATDRTAPTAIEEPLKIVDAHVADSLTGLELDAVRGATTIADVGAGAGFPGLALAIALPGARVSLVESRSRKCAYMSRLVGDLALANAEPVCARVEEWREGIERHDLVVARAVGPQPLVLEYAAPLLSLGGALVDWRGIRDPGDEDSALRAADELGLERREVRHVVPFEGAEHHHLHLFEKVAPTPARFPRRAGVARKRPLGGARASR